METGLIERNVVVELCAHRDQALKTMGDALALMQQGLDVANEAVKQAEMAYGCATFTLDDKSKRGEYERIFERLNVQGSTEAFRQQVDARTWMNLLSRTGMESMMDRTAKDELRQSLLGNVPEVTEDNVYATLEKLRESAREIFLRGIARAFIELDRRFKSHDGFKLGDRIILTRVFSEYGGWDYRSRVGDVIVDIERVFAVIDGQAPDARSLMDAVTRHRPGYEPMQSCTVSRYFKLRGYKNGNAHLWFARDELVDKVNLLLAEYYGQVLPDGVPADVTPEDIRTRSTALCKDLQFYPTPNAVIEDMMRNVWIGEECRVLEPSAGTGNIVRHILKGKAGSVHAVEVDPARVGALQAIARHDSRLRVTHANFLQMIPVPEYTHVVMNPPFHGTHYMQHIMHAWEFLAPRGILASVVPISAELGESKAHEAFRAWLGERNGGYNRNVFHDLPLGAFAESGTRISTGYVVLCK